jgi:hypothetical protein
VVGEASSTHGKIEKCIYNFFPRSVWGRVEFEGLVVPECGLETSVKGADFYD